MTTRSDSYVELDGKACTGVFGKDASAPILEALPRDRWIGGKGFVV